MKRPTLNKKHYLRIRKGKKGQGGTVSKHQHFVSCLIDARYNPKLDNHNSIQHIQARPKTENYYTKLY